MRVQRTNKSGFTLVEILIVVIILGILAAIVIPQFTNASQDARKSSLTSQLQTMRSQIELYKLQHVPTLPPGLTTVGTIVSATAWKELTLATDLNGTANVAGKYGPYLQSAPVNPLNNSSDVKVVAADVAFGGASGCTTEGFIFNNVNGKIWASSSKFTKVYNESDPSAATNDQ